MNLGKKFMFLIVAIILGGVLLLGTAIYFYVKNRGGDDATTASFDPRVTDTVGQPNDRISLYMRSQAGVLDPARIITATDNEIAMRAFGQLVKLDEYENIRPFLASRWTISPDGLTYTFTLRRDIVFNNGRPLTSDDVVYTFKRLFSSSVKSKVAQYLFGYSICGTKDYFEGKSSEIDGIRAIDDYTVVFELNERKADFLSVLSHGPTTILPKGTKYEELKPEEIVSAGPFFIKSFAASTVVLIKNKAWPTNIFIDEIRLEYTSGGPCIALSSNKFDIIDAGPYDGSLCSNENYDMLSYPGANIWFIAFGKRISRSVAKILYDCSDLALYNESLGSSADQLYSVFPGIRYNEIHYDDEKAPLKCSLDNMTLLTLIVSSRHNINDEKMLSIFRNIQNVKVQIKVVDDIEHRSLRASGEYDLLYTEVIGLFSDLIGFASIFYSGGSIVTSGYNNKQYDALVEDLRRTADKGIIEDVVVKINGLLADDPAAIFLKQHRNVKWIRRGLNISRSGWYYGYFID